MSTLPTSQPPSRTPDVGRLRRYLLAIAAALVLLVAGFFGSARLRRMAFHLDLPGHLGADIAQTAEGFTYSQSDGQGHTLFTIRASHFIEYKRDEAELKDATVTLYGPPGANRSDRISGADFFYNRKSGIVRAPGAVTIDFAPPNSANTPHSSRSPENIHVTTSGLTFSQNTGEATTDQRVDFSTSRASGTSMGAQYTAKTGVLILDHQVALTVSPEPGAPADATPTLIHADHAQLLRDQHRALLEKPDTVSDGGHATSDHATIDFRPDGSAQHLLAVGHLHIVTPEGGDIHAGTGNADLDPQSQPTLALLTGGVTYADRGQGAGDETTDASAAEATLNFAPAAAPGARAAGSPTAPRTRESLQHAQFRQAVHVVVAHPGLDKDPAGHSTRELHSPTLDVDFAPDPSGKAVAQHALAKGGATVDLRDYPSPSAVASSKGAAPHAKQQTLAPHGTTVRGDTLFAVLANGHQLRTLDGTGHTDVIDLASDGTVSSSIGNTLHATFVEAKSTAAGGSNGANGIDTATQNGNVLLTQTPPPGTRNSDGTVRAPMHATGEHAEYHASDQVMHLTGTPDTPPHLWNQDTELTATRVDYHRDSGNAEAWGDVRATDNQKPAPPAQQGSTVAQAKPAGPTLGGNGPVHITADHARMLHAENTSYFYAGGPDQLARMWQGADQVNAPVLILNRAASTLDARASDGPQGGSSAVPVVHAALGAQSSGEPTHKQQPGTANPATRITSVTLHYSDTLHQADFDGQVVAQQGLSVTHSDHATAFFTAATPNHPSQLDHILSTGHVVLMQPGRRGVGEQLLYTAADERYVLTGSPAAPPRATDRERGTTTGAALVFTNNADAEVQVLNQAPGATASPHAPHTTTDTTSPH